MASFFWSVPGLFKHFMPYTYVAFLIILLTDRAHRDDSRCHAKYGKYWDQYCKHVPNKILPNLAALGR
jgi:7-dehydrocholesterol reductase